MGRACAAPRTLSEYRPNHHTPGLGRICSTDWFADGYGAYDTLSRAGPGFTLGHCWAHVRRKFIEAEAHYPAPCRKLLELVGQLYAVEREIASLSVLDENNALRRQQRDERSRRSSEKFKPGRRQARHQRDFLRGAGDGDVGTTAQGLG